MVKQELFERMTNDELPTALAYWTGEMCRRKGTAVTIASLFVQAQALAAEVIVDSDHVVIHLSE